MMRRIGAIALGFALGVGAAAAQVGNSDRTIGASPSNRLLELTPSQRTAILQAVRNERKNAKAASPKTTMQPSVGAQVPPSMELYILPDHILAEMPATKILKYTMLEDKVVLVDPTNLRIVDIIDR